MGTEKNAPKLPETVVRQAALLKALADPTRLMIFKLLLGRKYCGQALAACLGVSEAAICQHAKKLTAAGLIFTEKYGYHTHYVADRDALAQLGESLCLLQNTPLVGDGQCHCSKECRDCRCIGPLAEWYPEYAEGSSDNGTV